MPSGKQNEEHADKILQVALQRITQLDQVFSSISDDDDNEVDLNTDGPVVHDSEVASDTTKENNGAFEDLKGKELEDAGKEAASEDCAVVLAGFRFCAQEALRFLMQEEHLAPTDPIIKELEQFLKNRQQNLEYERILEQIEPGTDDSGPPQLQTFPKCKE